MQTSIVTETIIAMIRTVDVSMLSRDAEIWLSSGLRKSHMVRADQTIAVVANCPAPAQIYTRYRENVTRPLSRAMNNCQLQPLRQRGKTLELNLEFRVRPVCLGAIDIRHVDTQARQHATGSM